MSLLLDARQRAMLLEMGVRMWTHAAATTAATLTAAATAKAAAPAAHSQRPSQAHRTASREPAPGLPTPPMRPMPPEHAAPAAAATAWVIEAPRLLYPEADPSQAPAALGAGWLVVAEAFAPGDPSAQSAQRLLHAMLQALQLQRHPRVGLCSIGVATGTQAPHTGLAMEDFVAAFAPSVVLLMGRGAVQAALGRRDPLGTLRGEALALAGVPVVVTYDPRFLLRNALSKPSAWDDLCRARALAGRHQGREAVP